jgi:hypothetical protein
MKIRKSIAQPRTEVEQRGRRATRDAGVSVGGTGDDAFKEAEHTPHGGNVIQGGDKVHLAGSGVPKAHVDAIGLEG